MKSISLIFATIFTSAIALRMDMKMSRGAILKPFLDKNAFKVISGLTNFDEELVTDVARAATEGGASHIDIACSPALVRAAKAVTHLPICVSSIYPEEFVPAVRFY